MSILTLENNTLKASIKTLGAELSSLIDKRTQQERIWQAEPTVWPRHAPILFPIVGKVENDIYKIGELKYDMLQHGFARNREFIIEKETSHSATFLLPSDSETFVYYPYLFELRITYSLEGDTLNVTYQVDNMDEKPIWFSIGGHPGLVCPFKENESFSDYLLEFEQSETVDRLLFASGLRTGEKQVGYLKNEKQIALNYGLFEEDAVILEGIKSPYVDLKHKESGSVLRFHFKGFPLVAFWTKPGMNAPFLCIEPWYGVADVQGANKDFREKDFIQKLDRGAQFQCAYGIQLLV